MRQKIRKFGEEKAVTTPKKIDSDLSLSIFRTRQVLQAQPFAKLLANMTQGAIKKTPKASFSKTKKPQSKGRVVKPKKAKSSTADKVIKKFSSGLVAQTEALLGERAGHLELIGKGKKGDKLAATKKGGSKKFG